MPSVITSGVHDFRSFAFTSAPLSIRYCAIEAAPQYAAACSGVSPAALAARTSMPSSTINLTASSALASGIGVIRGAIEQEPRVLKMMSYERGEQRRHAVGGGFVDVGACGEQQPRHLDAALARREQQRRESGRRPRLRVRAAFEQQAGDIEVLFR